VEWTNNYLILDHLDSPVFTPSVLKKIKVIVVGFSITTSNFPVIASGSKFRTKSPLHLFSEVNEEIHV
jgi:hypothetical protein